MSFLPDKSFAPRAAKPRSADAPEDSTPRSLREFVDDVREAARFAADFRAELAQISFPDRRDSDALFNVAQTLFEADVIRRGELKDHISLRRLRQADRSIGLRESTLDLSRERFHFRAAEAVFTHFEKIKAIHENQSLPQPEKIERMRAILFAALPLPSADQPAADQADDLDPA